MFLYTPEVYIYIYIYLGGGLKGREQKGSNKTRARTNDLTRVPPSQFVNLPPRIGKLLETGRGPPLSLVNQMKVFSHNPAAFIAIVTLPIASSSAVTMPWCMRLAESAM